MIASYVSKQRAGALSVPSTVDLCRRAEAKSLYACDASRRLCASLVRSSLPCEILMAIVCPHRA